jgi:hypothetical protein
MLYSNYRTHFRKTGGSGHGKKNNHYIVDDALMLSGAAFKKYLSMIYECRPTSKSDKEFF